MLFSAIRTLISGGRVELSSVIPQIVSVLFVAIFILPLHEFAHAFVAVKLGDNTPKYDKRLTLNPLASVDPMGALFLLMFGFGWARPVQINSRNFNNPKRGMAITALAGPVANLIAALVGALIYIPFIEFAPYSKVSVFFYYFLYSYIVVNISLAVFNFIPLPPLDGSRIVGAFLSDRALYNYYRYQNIIVMIFFFVMLSGFLSVPLSMAESTLFKMIMSVAELPYKLFGVI